MPVKTSAPSRWDSIKKWMVGLTSILVVVPALINSGIDVYKSALSIPRTEAEHTNVQMFQKYFNTSPVASFPLPVKHKGATYEAKFSIYEEGDVYIEFGAVTKWFPFPEAAANNTKVGWSLIPSAHAQTANPAQAYGKYHQEDTAQGSMLQRRRTYESGAVENIVIEMRTGAVVSRSLTPPPSNAQQNKNSVAPFAGIDLDRPRAPSSSNQPMATMCVTQAGKCALLQAGPRGASCFCPTTYGNSPGQAN